jgi:hypothetical protein
VIVCRGALAALAAKVATTTIPIVFSTDKTQCDRVTAADKVIQ